MKISGWTPKDRRFIDAERQAAFDESTTKPELIEACAESGLPTDGTKADLIARLRGEDTPE